MKEDNGSLCGENHDDKQNNDRYSIVDAVGKQHVFIAGKDGVTEEWRLCIWLPDWRKKKERYCGREIRTLLRRRSYHPGISRWF